MLTLCCCISYTALRTADIILLSVLRVVGAANAVAAAAAAVRGVGCVGPSRKEGTKERRRPKRCWLHLLLLLYCCTAAVFSWLYLLLLLRCWLLLFVLNALKKNNGWIYCCTLMYCMLMLLISSASDNRYEYLPGTAQQYRVEQQYEYHQSHDREHSHVLRPC